MRTVFTNYKIPYLTISPTYSVCPVHGYLPGEQSECPICKMERRKKLQKKLDALEAEKQEILNAQKTPQ